jgi:hypothetical protein
MRGMCASLQCKEPLLFVVLQLHPVLYYSAALLTVALQHGQAEGRNWIETGQMKWGLVHCATDS